MKGHVRILALLGLLVLLVLANSGSAETFAIELPELIGPLEPYPNGSTAWFDFGTPFLQIEQVRIRMKGTIAPFSYPEISVYMEPGLGSCFTFLHPLESPFDNEETFTLKYGATWDFLLDGKGELTADLLWPVVPVEQELQVSPTVEISQAYLTIEGIIPEPSSRMLFMLGTLFAKRLGKRPRP